MADRRMEEFTHLEQKRNRIDKPTLKEAKRLIELSEKEFTILEHQIEIQSGEIQPEIDIRSKTEMTPEFVAPTKAEMRDEPLIMQEPKNKRIIKVKEKIENTREHFEEKFEPRLEELEKLEREMMKEITQDLPFNNFSPDIQDMIDAQYPPPQQPPQNFKPNNINNLKQPEPQNSDFPTNIQDIQQPPPPQQPYQPDTTDFPIQPEMNDSKQPQPFKAPHLQEQISPNVINYDKEPQTQPFQEQTPQQFPPKKHL